MAAYTNALIDELMSDMGQSSRRRASLSQILSQLQSVPAGGGASSSTALGNNPAPSPSGGSRSQIANLGRQLAAQRGWSGGEWDALNRLVMSESGWNPNAQNPTSTAYGIGQFLNSTWAEVGGRKTSDPSAQIKYMLDYIGSRYRDPVNAWRFKQGRNWY